MSTGLRDGSCRGLLAAVFVVVQVAALSHELQHVLHQHDEPCGLHVVAAHLAMATAPEPAVAGALMPAAYLPLPPTDAPTASPLRVSSARSPPVLV
jgi:hypothetical protein